MEGLYTLLAMEVKGDRGSEGEEEGGGNQRTLGALVFLTQEAEPSGTTLVDSRNGLNELNLLAMLWTVRHRWLAEEKLRPMPIGIERKPRPRQS